MRCPCVTFAGGKWWYAPLLLRRDERYICQEKGSIDCRGICKKPMEIECLTPLPDDYYNSLWKEFEIEIRKRNPGLTKTSRFLVHLEKQAGVTEGQNLFQSRQVKEQGGMTGEESILLSCPVCSAIPLNDDHKKSLQITPMAQV